MYHLRVPQTEEELEAYYQFRWEMLRKPLHQPKGSERDAWDAMAHHQMVMDEEGNLVAVGRLYINADNEASIRFMAVHPSVQDKGLGTLMAMTLESVARQEGVKRVTCSAREDAVVLVVSQFTLAADTERGMRPSFSKGAAPDRAEALYEYFVERCRQQEMNTQTGRFAADMQVSLVNDGPVTFWLQV